MTIKGNLINFNNYLTMAEEFAKLGIHHKVEGFLIAADAARENIYRSDKTNPELTNMSKQISEARTKLLA